MQSIKERYRKLVFFTWFLTLDLIMFGAFVRLTDSGLGCPDWPGCYGKVTPLGAMTDIQQAAQAMPYGPVTLSKAWIEMIHRYVGAFLGLLIIAIVWMAWRYRRELGRSPVLAVVTLVAVCVQGAFGAWTVTHKLMPAVVTLHLVLGLSLLALITWLAARERTHDPVPARAVRWRPWLILGVALLAVQIALGQHQLCGAGLPGLSDLPRRMAARDGFLGRVFGDPGAGRAAFGRDDFPACPDRDPLGAP
jgi:cytochrome c oxidase assembly protein subunit 15